jgi:hypothetical protein
MTKRPAAIAFPAETSRQVESIFRGHLERNFQGVKLKFDSIEVEPAYGADTFHVTVVYDGDRSLLNPHTFNSISVAMEDQLEALGIRTTVIEPYICKAQHDMRDELLADFWEEWEELDEWERLWTGDT